MDASSFNYPEVIVRCTSIMAVDSLVRPYDVEKANQIRSQAINDEGTGLLDMLRKGEITLYQSEDESKYKGILRPVSINTNTTGGVADVRGKSSYPWDIIKIIISAGGTFTAGSANKLYLAHAAFSCSAVCDHSCTLTGSDKNQYACIPRPELTSVGLGMSSDTQNFCSADKAAD